MIGKLFKLLIGGASLAVTVSEATPTQAEIDAYPEWAAIMTTEGYDWESYKVKTGD